MNMSSRLFQDVTDEIIKKNDLTLGYLIYLMVFFLGIKCMN